MIIVMIISMIAMVTIDGPDEYIVNSEKEELREMPTNNR